MHLALPIYTQSKLKFSVVRSTGVRGLCSCTLPLLGLQRTAVKVRGDITVM